MTQLQKTCPTHYSIHESEDEIQSFVAELESVYLMDRPPEPGVERRKSKRLKVTLPTEIRLLDDELQPTSFQFNAITRDISAKGVGLVSRHPMGERNVLLTFEAFNGRTFDVIAEVVYCNPLGYYFQIGCKFMLTQDMLPEGLHE